MAKSTNPVEQENSATEVMSGSDLARTNGESQKRTLSDVELAEVESWDDISRLMADKAINSIDFSDFGTGFEVLDKRDKDRLVGIEFAILDWRFNAGDFGDRGFVSLMVLTRDGRKFVVNDGSTGICQQMQMVQAKLDKAGAEKGFIRCPKGLKKSEYFTMLPDPKTGENVKTPATTYYLSTEK